MDNSIKNSRSLNCSDPEDEHEVLDKSVETDQLKECGKQKKLVNLRAKEGTGISEKKMDNSRNSYHGCLVFRSFWLGKNCYR